MNAEERFTNNEERAPKKSRQGIVILLAISLTAVMGFGIFLAVNISEFLEWRHDGRNTMENTLMVQNIFSAPMSNIVELVATVAAAEYDDEEQGPDLTQFAGLISALYEVRELTGNEHIVAYMYIPGTNVNNVVMHSHNNSFYLNRDVFGHHNSNGSLFVDYQNSPCFTDHNTIVYGHNMNNGNMFHNLRHYAFGDDREDFFRDHPHIFVVTDTEVLVYEIFSVFTTDTYFNYIQVRFEDDEFPGLVDEFNRRRLYDTGVTAGHDDNVLVLSTCSHVNNRIRIVVASRLAQRIEIR